MPLRGPSNECNASNFQVDVSQIRRVLSLEQDARRLPSAKKLSPVTESWWGCREIILELGSRTETSQAYIPPLRVPATSHRPSGLNVSSRTPVFPIGGMPRRGSLCIPCLLCISMRSTQNAGTPLYFPIASRFPSGLNDRQDALQPSDKTATFLRSTPDRHVAAELRSSTGSRIVVSSPAARP